MSALDQPALVPVQLGYCPCEGKPHPDGDIVFLHPDLSAPSGIKARSFFADAMMSKLEKAEAEGLLTELWLTVGVAEWTFLFDDGTPIPVTPENVVRALPYAKGGRQVADKADDLYAISVSTPLLEALGALSKPGSTRSSRRATSRTTTSRTRRRRPSSTPDTDRLPPPA